MLTFDDGFRDNFDVAYPLFVAARAIATIFVCTDLLTPTALRGTADCTKPSPDRAPSTDWDGRHYDLDDAAGRKRAADAQDRAQATAPT